MSAMAPAEAATALQEAPAIYHTPAERPSLPVAREWCRQLAESHYENFHVVTWFLPRALKPHFQSVYAFCRTSDDLGDEVASPAVAMRLLGEWRGMLHECFLHPERSRHPVFVALQPTIAACALPREPFDDLITAFEADQRMPKHASLATLEEYSRYSANPVGRLVLMLSGYRDPELFALSDEICTALQLANFYQDVVSDWVERGRRYLPAEEMVRFGVTDRQIEERHFDHNFQAMMSFLVADARARFRRGSALPELVGPELAGTLRLFLQGGFAILDAIEAQGYDTLGRRPVVSKLAKLRLLGGVLRDKLLPERGRAR